MTKGKEEGNVSRVGVGYKPKEIRRIQDPVRTVKRPYSELTTGSDGRATFGVEFAGRPPHCQR